MAVWALAGSAKAKLNGQVFRIHVRVKIIDGNRLIDLNSGSIFCTSKEASPFLVVFQECVLESDTTDTSSCSSWRVAFRERVLALENVPQYTRDKLTKEKDEAVRVQQSGGAGEKRTLSKIKNNQIEQIDEDEDEDESESESDDEEEESAKKKKRGQNQKKGVRNAKKNRKSSRTKKETDKRNKRKKKLVKKKEKLKKKEENREKLKETKAEALKKIAHLLYHKRQGQEHYLIYEKLEGGGVNFIVSEGGGLDEKGRTSWLTQAQETRVRFIVDLLIAYYREKLKELESLLEKDDDFCTYFDAMALSTVTRDRADDNSILEMHGKELGANTVSTKTLRLYVKNFESHNGIAEDKRGREEWSFLNKFPQIGFQMKEFVRAKIADKRSSSVDEITHHTNTVILPSLTGNDAIAYIVDEVGADDMNDELITIDDDAVVDGDDILDDDDDDDEDEAQEGDNPKEQVKRYVPIPKKLSQSTVGRYMKKSGITFGWRKQSFFNDCHQREDVVQYRNGPYKDGCIEHRERTYSWVPENFVLREDEGRVENDEDKAMREESMQQLKYTGGVFSDVAFDANGLLIEVPPTVPRKNYIDVDSIAETGDRKNIYNRGGLVSDKIDWGTQCMAQPCTLAEFEAKNSITSFMPRTDGVQTDAQIEAFRNLAEDGIKFSCLKIQANGESLPPNSKFVYKQGSDIDIPFYPRKEFDELPRAWTRIGYCCKEVSAREKGEEAKAYKMKHWPSVYASHHHGTSLLQELREGVNPSNGSHEHPQAGIHATVPEAQHEAIWGSRVGPPQACPCRIHSAEARAIQQQAFEDYERSSEWPWPELRKEHANRVERNKLTDEEIDTRHYYEAPSRVEKAPIRKPCGIDNDYRTCRCRLSLIAVGTDEAIFSIGSMPKKIITLDGIQPLLPKTDGVAIMVSGVTSESRFGMGLKVTAGELEELNMWRKVKYDGKKKELTESPGNQTFLHGVHSDGYWTNVDFVTQVNDVLDLFELFEPSSQVCLETDNSGAHAARAPNGLSSKKMNLSYGGQQPIVRDSIMTADCLGLHPATMPNNKQANGPPIDVKLKIDQIQRSSYPSTKKDFQLRELRLVGQINPKGEKITIDMLANEPKGTKQLLWERGHWPPDKNLSAVDAKNLLGNLPDYLNEESIFMKICRERGHYGFMSPKASPELAGSGIEYIWGFAKRMHRNMNITKGAVKGIDNFKKRLKFCLGGEDKDAYGGILGLERVMRFARRARDYLRVQTGVLGNLSYLKIEQLRKKKATHRSAYDNDRSCIDAEVENAMSVHNERNPNDQI